MRTLGVLRGCCLTLGVFRGCWRTLGVFRFCFRVFWPDCLTRAGELRGFCLALWLQGRLTRTTSSLLRPEPARTFVACRSRFGLLLEVDTCLPRFGLRFGEFDPAKRDFLLRSGCCLISRRSRSNRLGGPLPLLDETAVRFRSGRTARYGCRRISRTGFKPRRTFRCLRSTTITLRPHLRLGWGHGLNLTNSQGWTGRQ